MLLFQILFTSIVFIYRHDKPFFFPNFSGKHTTFHLLNVQKVEYLMLEILQHMYPNFNLNWHCVFKNLNIDLKQLCSNIAKNKVFFSNERHFKLINYLIIHICDIKLDYHGFWKHNFIKHINVVFKIYNYQRLWKHIMFFLILLNHKRRRNLTSH